jgi:hypothetical protein
MSQQTAIINGINYSWANITLILFGNPVFGITKIKYSNKQKKENNFGAGSKAISRGYGNYNPTASLELYQDEWRAIIAASPNRDPLQIAPFNIQVLYGQINNLSLGQDNLLAAEFTDDEGGGNQGDTKLLISVPLIIGDVAHIS